MGDFSDIGRAVLFLLLFNHPKEKMLKQEYENRSHSILLNRLNVMFLMD